MAGLSSIGSLDAQQVSAIVRYQKLGMEIARNNERIAANRRIASAADDPSGLISALRLQGELETLQSTADGLNQANALLGTAASAAEEIVSQLQAARGVALEAFGGTLSGTEIAAKQVELDSILRGIDTLARTEFNGRRLLDGSSAYTVTGANPSQIRNVQVLDKQTDRNLAVAIQITTQATRATNSYTGGTLGGAAQVTIAGPGGTTSLSLASGATTDDIAAAFNSVSALTGVTATRIDANQVDFATAAYGTRAEFSISATSGSFATTTAGTVTGTDGVAVINGQTVTGDGSTFSVATGQSQLTIAIDPGASGVLNPLTISGAGLEFTLGTSLASPGRIGLPSLATPGLSSAAGNLQSLLTGGSNSLTSGNAATTISILDAAISTASVASSMIGSFQKYTVGSASAVVAKTQETTATALNDRWGLDVALESALLTNNQLLQQATLESLKVFSQQRQSLLDLLQFAIR